MHTKEDVAQLVAHIGELKIDPPIEIETSMFGLAAHLHDPITGQMMTLAQPNNIGSGLFEVLLTPKQAAAAVGASRAHHLHTIRGLGFPNLEAWNEEVKRKAVARDLAHKQELERTKLETEQSEATAKAAAENDPNKSAREAARKQDAANQKQANTAPPVTQPPPPVIQPPHVMS